jgi:hypothetical protein
MERKFAEHSAALVRLEAVAIDGVTTAIKMPKMATTHITSTRVKAVGFEHFAIFQFYTPRKRNSSLEMRSKVFYPIKIPFPSVP